MSVFYSKNLCIGCKSLIDFVVFFFFFFCQDPLEELAANDSQVIQQEAKKVVDDNSPAAAYDETILKYVTLTTKRKYIDLCNDLEDVQSNVVSRTARLTKTYIILK